MRTQALALAAAAALLQTLPLASAHGDDHAMDMAEHGNTEHEPVTEANVVGQEGWPMSYFSYTENVGLLWTYVALTVITWVVIAPPGAQLDYSYQFIARAGLTMPQL